MQSIENCLNLEKKSHHDSTYKTLRNRKLLIKDKLYKVLKKCVLPGGYSQVCHHDLSLIGRLPLKKEIRAIAEAISKSLASTKTDTKLKDFFELC